MDFPSTKDSSATENDLDYRHWDLITPIDIGAIKILNSEEDSCQSEETAYRSLKNFANYVLVIDLRSRI